MAVVAATTDPPPPPSPQEQECPMPNDQGFQFLVGATSGSAAPLLPGSTAAAAAAAADMPQGWYADNPVPTRRGLDSSPALFLWESRTTNIDVMSVSNTTRPVAVSSSRNSERRRIQVVLPYGVGAATAAKSGSRGRARMDLPDSPATTALEARLNEARQAKRGQDLRRERKCFLTRLTQEREERVLLEAGAAAKIQALFRGFLARPRPPRPRPRQTLTPAESNRRLVADLQAILARAGLPTIPGLGPDGRKAVEGSDWGQGRGVATRRGGATQGSGGGAGGGRPGGRGAKGLRRSRSRSRKFRAFEDEMGTRISKVVRGFLERRRFERRWAAWDEERRWAGASLIQRAWRSYHKRMGWHHLESGVMDCAVTKVQARWRGMSCRMALTRRREEEALWKRKTVSAVTIQAAARRRCMVARYGPRLTLIAERRQREARAAAEAARPRRRRNWGGPAGAAGAAGDDVAAAGPRASIFARAERGGPRQSVVGPAGGFGVGWNRGGPAGAAGAAVAAVAGASPRASIFARAERGPRQSILGPVGATGVGWDRGGPASAASAAVAAVAAVAAASPRASISVPVSGVKVSRAERGGRPRRSVMGSVGELGVEDSTSGIAAGGEGLGRKEGGMAETPPGQAGARPAQPTLDPAANREAREDSGGVGINGTISSSKSGVLPGMEGRPTEGPAEGATVLSPASRKEEHAHGRGGGGSQGTEACRGQEHHDSPAGDAVPITSNNNTQAEATTTATATAATATSDRSGPPNATTDSRTEAKVGGVRFTTEAGESPSEIGRLASERVSLLFVEDSVQAAVVRRARETSAEGTARIPAVLEGAAAVVGVLPSASPLPDNMRGATAVAVATDV